MYISEEKKNMLALLFSANAVNVELALSLAESQNMWVEPYLGVVDCLSSPGGGMEKSIIEKLSNLSLYTQLYFMNRKLVGFTHVFNYLTHLEIMSLENNLFSDIPDYFINYNSLKELRLRNNDFKDFPIVLTQLPKLCYLFLNNNKITEIPTEIGNMKGLEKLFLGNNLITTLPEEMQYLSRLTNISLADNPLDFSKIPPVLFDETKSPKALVNELARLKRYAS